MSWFVENEAGQVVAFPKGTPMNTIKEFHFSGSANFFLDFMYTDLSDLGTFAVIARFKIDGPFQSSTGAKFRGKFRVKLNGVVHVESASISSGGEDIELQVSRCDELEEAPEASQQENTDEEYLDTSTELQGTTEEENITKIEDELNKIKSEAHNESQEHEKTKIELLDTLTELQETKHSLQIEKRKITKVKDELNKTKREARYELEQHEMTKKELSDISAELQGMRSSLEIEKEKNIKLEEELHKMREAPVKSRQHEKTKDELERQKKLLLEESQRHQQSERDLQDAFVEVDKTKSALQANTNSLIEELTKKSNELEELREICDEKLNENEMLKTGQNNIVKDLENLRQVIAHASPNHEDQVSNNHDIANSADFTYAELEEATNDFNDNSKIGEGGYGSVYKGVIHCTTVAIKVLKRGKQAGGERVRTRGRNPSKG